MIRMVLPLGVTTADQCFPAIRPTIRNLGSSAVLAGISIKSGSLQRLGVDEIDAMFFQVCLAFSLIELENKHVLWSDLTGHLAKVVKLPSEVKHGNRDNTTQVYA